MRLGAGAGSKGEEKEGGGDRIKRQRDVEAGDD